MGLQWSCLCIWWVHSQVPFWKLALFIPSVLQTRFLWTRPRFKRHKQYCSHDHVSSQTQQCLKGYLFQKDLLNSKYFYIKKVIGNTPPISDDKADKGTQNILCLVPPEKETQEQLPFVLAGIAAYCRAHIAGTEHQLWSGKHTVARSTAVPVLTSSSWAYSSPELLFYH